MFDEYFLSAEQNLTHIISLNALDSALILDRGWWWCRQVTDAETKAWRGSGGWLDHRASEWWSQVLNWAL